MSLLGKEQFDDTYNVRVSLWKRSDDLQYQIYQTNEIAHLIHRIQSECTQAVKYLDVMQGIVPYSRISHSETTVKNRLFHSSEKLSDEYGLWIRGRSISRYSFSIAKKEYLKYGEWLHRPRKKKYFEGPRILVQEITGGHPPRISACYCNSVLYHDPGIISCLNIGEFHIYFMLGILNSSFLSWYHRHSSPKGARRAFPKVLINDVRKFPIPPISLENQRHKTHHDQVVALVDRMLTLYQQLAAAKMAHDKTVIQRQIEATDRQIDGLVYGLYGLTGEEVGVVEGRGV